MSSSELSYDQLVERIHYSEKYTDDEWEYRHVILPKPLLKQIPKEYFDPDEPGVLRILKDSEWRGIGITQSLGWEHYEVHVWGQWKASREEEVEGLAFPFDWSMLGD